MPSFAELVQSIHEHPIATMAALVAIVALGKVAEGVKRRVADKRHSSRPPKDGEP